ncbi:MAG TPA: glycosyl hydrolase 108 family protein [Oligoflexus sp.]|uniref:glycoside hydrolase family 108 protein n=1 Tax=Oligoflexus sp. TaxID=1971216 RepID=UPI002D6874BB|nr:glycosyl hydrolase 108 family protein [Oligoflexus sp.]HYX36841.1 glycosyl hydrolase 108 family protein [Oligoflexus sp.]
MKTFDEMIDFILDEIERGYANIIPDNGGETNWGISSVNHPELKGRIKSLTREEAKQIYWDEYWLKAEISSYPERLRLAVFDGAINHGVVGNNKLVQRALNSMRCKIDVDGILGPMSKGAVRQVSPLRFLAAYNRQRLELYRQHEDYRWAKNGWETRLFMTCAAS